MRIGLALVVVAAFPLAGVTLAAAAQTRDALTAPAPPARSGDWYVGATFVTNSAGWGLLMPRSQVVGALVVLVIADSPAATAGLSPGDVIVGIDDQQIRNERRLSLVLRRSVMPTHDLAVVGPDGAVRPVRVDARSRPSTGLADRVQQQIATDPTPANRLLFAQVAPDANAALAILDDLLGRFPDVAEAHAAKAQRLLDIGVARNERSDERVSAIRAALDRAVALDQQSLVVQLTAARVLAALGDGELAGAHAEQSVAIDETSAAAHHLLGTIRLDQGRADQALDDLRQAVGLDPYVADYYRSLIAAYRMTGHAALARSTERALESLLEERHEPAASANLARVALATAVAVAGGVMLAVLVRRKGHTGETEASEPAAVGATRLIAAEAGCAVALLSIAVPWVERVLDLSAGATFTAEVVGHVAPGIIILAASALIIRREITASKASASPALTVIVGLAAVWLTGTHVPVLLDAVNRRVGVEVAALHAAAGPIMCVLTVVMYRSRPMGYRLKPRTIGARRS